MSIADQPAGTSDRQALLDRIDALFWPDLVILGGGVSKKADKFISQLTTRPRVVAAELLNEAGIIGAAMRAAETAVVAISAEPEPDPKPARARARPRR